MKSKEYCSIQISAMKKATCRGSIGLLWGFGPVPKTSLKLFIFSAGTLSMWIAP